MEKSTNYIYEIFDLLGKHYLNGKSNSQQNQIDVSNLPIGLFLINIKTDAGKSIHKFIKQ